VESQTAAHAVATPPELVLGAAAGEGGWDAHHHVLWSNERSVGSKRLNPVQTRSYFDRMRTPTPASRSIQPHHTCAQGSNSSGMEGQTVVGPITRVLPSWRLEADPGEFVGHDGQDSPLPRPPSLVAHGGTGGGLCRGTHASSGSSGGPECGGMSTVGSESGQRGASDGAGREAGVRERLHKWNPRHQLLFKNEEVSRLDRCYFDRWREPEALLTAGANEDRERQSCKVWSLERSGSCEEAAVAVRSASDARHKPCGEWNSRHHLMFHNGLHQNCRSYFDRWREPTDPTHPGLASVDPDASPEPLRAMTVAAEGRRRCKLGEGEKLPVRWKLQDYGAKVGVVASSLRSCTSAPGTLEAQRLERRRAAWFSSHGVAF